MSDFATMHPDDLVDFALDSGKVSALDAEEKQELIKALADFMYSDGYGSER